MDDIGFLLISLVDGFVIVTALDLGAPPWAVAPLAVAAVVVGHRAIGRAKRRAGPAPALPSDRSCPVRARGRGSAPPISGRTDVRYHGAVRWRIQADEPQQALFADEALVERHVGSGEFRGMEFLHVNARTVINRVAGGSRMPFEWTINAYRGCSHACSYCFARPTHAYLDLGIGADFDRKIVVKVNAVERVRAELASPAWGGHHIAMGTNTVDLRPQRLRHAPPVPVEDAQLCGGEPGWPVAHGHALGRASGLARRGVRFPQALHCAGLTTRGGSGRLDYGPRRWPGSSARATPARAPPPSTSSCWTWRWKASPPTPGPTPPIRPVLVWRDHQLKPWKV